MRVAFAALGAAGLLLQFTLDEPLAKPLAKLQLEEVWVNGLDPAVPFGTVLDMDVDDNGNVYVLDAGFATIRKFAKNGEYLGDIGGEGEAPGEFYDPTCLAYSQRLNGLHIAGGTSRVSTVACSGSPIDFHVTRVTQLRAQSIIVDGEGDVLLCSLDMLNQTMIQKYSGTTGEHLISFGKSFAFGQDIDTRVERVLAGGALAYNPETRVVLFAQARPQIFYGFTEQGEEIFKIQGRVDETRPEIPKVESGTVTFRSGAKSTGIVFLKDRFLAAVFLPGDTPSENKILVDLYDSVGSRIATTQREVSFIPMTARGDRIYVKEEREDQPVIACYSVSVK